MNCLIWLTMSSWIGLSWRPSIFFKFSVVAAVSLSRVRCSAVCPAVPPPTSWIEGSLNPPFRTTFFGVGQGGNVVSLEPLVSGLGGGAGLPTAVLAAAAFEQFAGSAFLWRLDRARDGLAGAAGFVVWLFPVEAGAVGSGLCFGCAG